MRNINIDRDWLFRKGKYDSNAIGIPVHLPHDYMIAGEVTPDAPGGSDMGYYTESTANYTRFLEIPAEWEGERIGLRFDGVMMNAVVEVNGSRVLLQHYGYAPFFADITNYVYCGKRNRLTVTVNPSMQPNSRWYSGAGIFRSVQLVHTPQVHIVNDGINVRTKEIIRNSGGDAAYALLQVDVDVANETAKNMLARVHVTILDDADGTTAVSCSTLVQVNPVSSATAYLSLTVPCPKLWDTEHPNLYTAEVSVSGEGFFMTHIVPNPDCTTDTDRIHFGIRTVTADVIRGLQINGNTVKLRGGCIHHDNGILGAVSLYDSEVRRIKKLKSIGFNAIRTAHNPPSAALLEACDRLGMYVFDEAFDTWGIAKCPGDYSMFFDTDWERDLTAFIRRDRSHPSVILWSTGNEITERGGLNNGYTLASRITEKVKSLDSSRPVSNGVCSFWCGQDDEMRAANMASLAQNEDLKGDTTWETYTEAFVNGLDIVGYNYMEDRYAQDHILYPERIILGSENFAQEIGYHWPMIESTPWVIGDFTWTAWDYLGEAGIGKSLFVPQDSAQDTVPSHVSPFPWRLANDADVDINGTILPQGNYRSVVWGSTDTYLFAYDPNSFGMKELLTGWGFTAPQASWNWGGREGKPIRLIVFSSAEEVEVFVNGTSIGRKAVCMEKPLPNSVTFDTVYHPGTVEAVSYRGGKEVSRSALHTTGMPAGIHIFAETERLKADGHSLAYIGVEIVDQIGRVVTDADTIMEAEFISQGDSILAGFGSANPITAENYTTGKFTSYRGRITAVIRSGYLPGDVTLRVKAANLGQAEITITVS